MQQIARKNLRREAGLCGFALVFYIALSNLIYVGLYYLAPVYQNAVERVTGVFIDRSLWVQLINIASYALALGGAILFLSLSGRASFFKLKPNRPYLALSVPLYLAIFLGYVVINMMTNILFALFGISEPSEALEIPRETLPLILKLVEIVALPAVLEELLFRGAILSRLRQFGDWPAVFFSGFLFAILHGSLTNLGGFLLFGLVLGYVCVKSNSLLPGIIIHALNNLTAVVANMVDDTTYNIMISIELIAGFFSVVLILLLCFVPRRGGRKPDLKLSRPVASLGWGFASAGVVLIVLVCGWLMAGSLEVSWL